MTKWKGDTSSDEVGAHFYATAIFHDLVARGPEKEQARQHAARIARHIIDNRWLLRDLDGSPTRWGRWDPGCLQRPCGYDEGSLKISPLPRPKRSSSGLGRALLAMPKGMPSIPKHPLPYK